MARDRSPNYPYIDLSEAVDRVKLIYATEGRSPVPREVMAKAMGYRGITGTSARVLGALNRYGLLEGRGEELRVSLEGLTLIQAPRDNPERASAIKKAAFMPELFSELRARFPDDRASVENLTYYLMKQGFSEEGARAAADIYQRTLNFVRLEAGLDASVASSVPDETVIDVPPVTSMPSRPDRIETSPPDDFFPDGGTTREVLRYRISKHATAQIIFSGPVTQGGIRKLVKLLELTADNYQEDDFISQP